MPRLQTKERQSWWKGSYLMAGDLVNDFCRITIIDFHMLKIIWTSHPTTPLSNPGIIRGRTLHECFIGGLVG